jgi:quercetin dioxygenase-like cupin family protein
VVLTDEVSKMAFEFFRSVSDHGDTVAIPALGLELAVRLPPEASGKALTIIETSNAAGFGPPLHRHRETEVFRVFEGRYLYEVDGKRFEAHPGDVVSVPGNAAHAFLNLGDTTARQLVMILPGRDAKGFFVGLGDIRAHGKQPQEVLNAFGASWGVEFLGPPLSAKSR